MVSTRFGEILLRRIEDAGLNASAPPQQRWLDGWLVRLSPGKAKRARCVNAVAIGVRPTAEKVLECEALFQAAGLPLFVRITPFTQPSDLDDRLAARGWHRIDDTRVMVLTSLRDVIEPQLPDGIEAALAGPAEYAQAVGALRGSTADQCAAHAQRLTLSPVPHSGLIWRRDGQIVACGQTAPEGPVVGLYDVFTASQERGRGLARSLCSWLLAKARDDGGAAVAYLQVEADNHAARSVYGRLGFADGYRYHYRCPDVGAR